MKRIDNIEEIHKILLDISKTFHDICQKNTIPYYMGYGTMLGAVRHQGFIPWDDDMDFGVEYKYYSLLVESLKRNLPSHLRCVTRYDKGGAVGGYLKVEDIRTLIDEKGRIDINDNTGIFIDIFILYPSEDATSYFSRTGLVKMCTLLQSYKQKIQRYPICIIHNN